jgi:hypothetical protein
MVKVILKVLKAKLILVNGKLASLKDMGFILIKLVINIKDNLKILLNMVKVFKNLLMVIFIKENIKMVNLTETDNTIGKTKVILKEVLKMD